MKDHLNLGASNDNNISYNIRAVTKLKKSLTNTVMHLVAIETTHGIL